MHKKLFLHIGTPKTGKTSLQYFCENNRKTLMDKGILYPENPNGYVNTNYIFKDGVTPKEAAGNFKKLCENSSRIFMSAEVFSGVERFRHRYKSDCLYTSARRVY